METVCDSEVQSCFYQHIYLVVRDKNQPAPPGNNRELDIPAICPAWHDAENGGEGMRWVLTRWHWTRGLSLACDWCKRFFNRLTWTNNYYLHIKKKRKGKETGKESKCLRTHPFFNLFKLLQNFSKLQCRVFHFWTATSFRGQVEGGTGNVTCGTNPIFQMRSWKGFVNIFNAFWDAFIIQREPIQNLSLKK